MPIAVPLPKLRVAIVGGGPGGLATAIALGNLHLDIDVKIYEQARELREVGAGINIQTNAWNVLDLLGAGDTLRDSGSYHIIPGHFHYNGVTGEELTFDAKDPSRLSIRTQRTQLQSTLLRHVAPDVIQLSKRLQRLEEGDVISLFFEDGSSAVADLVIGADGIRSAVRQHVFPGHKIAYTGRTIWRTVIPLSSIEDSTVLETGWWHGPSGHFYGSRVGDGLFEISCHAVEDPSKTEGPKFSWGIPATNERVISHFEPYLPAIRRALQAVPEGHWREFSSFAGPRLETIASPSKRILLVGDASHPLTGAFGSGAAFAMEDGWLLAQALGRAIRAGDPTPVETAVGVTDNVRSPYYHRMYDVLDAVKPATSLPFDEAVRAKARGFTEQKKEWIYLHNVADQWETAKSGQQHA